MSVKVNKICFTLQYLDFDFIKEIAKELKKHKLYFEDFKISQNS